MPDLRSTPVRGEALARQEAENAERALGRAVAAGLPALAVAGAVTVGAVVGVGPALLVLAGGALLGTITLFWASLRTLSGDAPLTEDFAMVAGRTSVSSGGAGERKRAALRALKDLEFERSVGKIDENDYDELVVRYRGEAKALMRELDVEIEPLRGRAEEIAKQYLDKRGFGEAHLSSPKRDEPEQVDHEQPRSEVAATVRVACLKCATSNEPDASFCKKCGDALRRTCGSCNATNEPDAAFCKKCGSRVGPKEASDVSA